MVPKEAAVKRKRKGSSAAPSGAAKRRAKSTQHHEPAEQDSGRSSADPVEDGSGTNPDVSISVRYSPLNSIDPKLTGNCSATGVKKEALLASLRRTARANSASPEKWGAA